MCLACELDALWYAECERLAAEGAGVAAAVSVAPAVSHQPAGPEVEGTAAARLAPVRGAAGDGEVSADPVRPAPACRSRFFCEET
jgi:hypothetical protein